MRLLTALMQGLMVQTLVGMLVKHTVTVFSLPVVTRFLQTAKVACKSVHFTPYLERILPITQLSLLKTLLNVVLGTRFSAWEPMPLGFTALMPLPSEVVFVAQLAIIIVTLSGTLALATYRSGQIERNV